MTQKLGVEFEVGKRRRASLILDFILLVVPNTLLQLDNSAWVCGGITINPSAFPARQRESINPYAVLVVALVHRVLA